MMTADKAPIGLYIHIPFCKSKCPYCDFYSFIPKSDIIDLYTQKLCRDISGLDNVFDTVYFGGGTPSSIGADKIAEILDKVHFTADAEITVECNPSDTGGKDTEFDFYTIAKSGVNRISMGLQSAVDTERKKLGRRSGCNEVKRAISRADDAGIDNISLDLMLGIPEQTDESLDKSLDFCRSSGAKHISSYMLQLEDGTYFKKHADSLNLPDEDATCDFYLHTCKVLSANGFEHYEISNFALNGYEGKHNLKYWRDEEYIGLGPAAHSFIDGKRFFYPNDIQKYLNGDKPIFEDIGGTIEEYIMLVLRLSSGINFGEFNRKFGYSLPEKFLNKCRDFAENEFGVYSDKSFSLTDRGFLISNSIICELTDCII